MTTLAAKDTEKGLMHMISWGLDQLSAVHKDYHNVLDSLTLSTEEKEVQHSALHDIVLNLWELLKPVIAIARARFPTFFAILDWAIDIVKKINAALAE